MPGNQLGQETGTNLEVYAKVDAECKSETFAHVAKRWMAEGGKHTHPFSHPTFIMLKARPFMLNTC